MNYFARRPEQSSIGDNIGLTVAEGFTNHVGTLSIPVIVSTYRSGHVIVEDLNTTFKFTCPVNQADVEIYRKWIKTKALSHTQNINLIKYVYMILGKFAMTAVDTFLESYKSVDKVKFRYVMIIKSLSDIFTCCHDKTSDSD